MDLTREWKKSSFSVLSPEANIRARNVVKRLAPEASVDGKRLIGPKLYVEFGNVVNHECCLYTFPSCEDLEIPVVERNLTLYLWRKLFPERFANRKNRQVWPLKSLD